MRPKDKLDNKKKQKENNVCSFMHYFILVEIIEFDIDVSPEGWSYNWAGLTKGLVS